MSDGESNSHLFTPSPPDEQNHLVSMPPRKIEHSSPRNIAKLKVELREDSIISHCGDEGTSAEEDGDPIFQFENVNTNGNENESFSSRLSNLRTELLEINDQIRQTKNECSVQNQTKLHSDIQFYQGKIKFMQNNIKRMMSIMNSNDGCIKDLGCPKEYDDILNQMKKQEKQMSVSLFEQVEGMCSILNQCPDIEFKIGASNVLSSKSIELQAVIEEKEAIVCDLNSLKDQFIKQNDFIEKQMHKKEKKTVYQKLMVKYFQSVQNIQSFTFEAEDHLSILLPPEKKRFHQRNIAPLKPVLKPGKPTGLSLSASHEYGNRTARSHSFFMPRPFPISDLNPEHSEEETDSVFF